MSKTKISFIRTIRLWGILFLVVLGAVIIALDLSGSYRDAQQRAEQMRADYIEQQRQRIRCEVERVAKLVDYETSQIVERQQSKIRTRVYKPMPLPSISTEDTVAVRVRLKSVSSLSMLSGRSVTTMVRVIFS